MYNTIISGKIKNIETIFSEKEDGCAQAYSLILLDNNKEYNIEGIIKGFEKNSDISLVKQKNYEKIEKYNVVNKMTLNSLKRKSFLFGVLGVLSSMYSSALIYPMIDNFYNIIAIMDKGKPEGIAFLLTDFVVILSSSILSLILFKKASCYKTIKEMKKIIKTENKVS